MNESSNQANKIIWSLFAVVGAWGAYLAIGAWLGDNLIGRNAMRGLMVAGCVTAFLGWWALALWMKARRDKK